MTTKKDDMKLKDAATMTAGVTASKLEIGATIDLHGHPAKITHTDADITTVQYANLTRRTFVTHDLNSYLDLKTFPVTTEFERSFINGVERAYINAVTGDCCYQVRIVRVVDLTVGTPDHKTMTYADLIAWHMTNPIPASGRPPVHYPPTIEDIQADGKREAGDESDSDVNPFETDLQQEVERLRKENFDLKADLRHQEAIHNTRLLAAADEVAALQRKVEALLDPPPKDKQVRTLAHKIGLEAEREKSDLTLADFLSDGWNTLDITICSIPDEPPMRYVTLVRDLPAAPAPKVAVTDAAVYSTPSTLRPPVTQPPPARIPVTPPLPANQIIMGLDDHKAADGWLTDNKPKVGDTKPIPGTYMQRHSDAEIFQDILDRNAAARAAILNQPSRPFGQ